MSDTPTLVTSGAVQSPEGPAQPSRDGEQPRGRRSGNRWWLSLVVLLAVGVLWEIVALLAGSPFFPRLTVVLERIGEDWLSGPAGQLFVSDELAEMVSASLGRLVPGFVLGALAGAVLGVAIGLMPRFRAFAYPLVHFWRSVPGVALIPLFILLLGLGDTSKIWLIANGVAWPVLINVVAGVRSVEPLMTEAMRSYGAGPAQRVRWVAVPAATPHLFAGLRIATMIALAVMTVAEMYASSSGIGYHVLYSQRQFDIVGMWAGVLLLAALGLAMSAVLNIAERRLLTWHRGIKAASR